MASIPELISEWAEEYQPSPKTRETGFLIQRLFVALQQGIMRSVPHCQHGINVAVHIIFTHNNNNNNNNNNTNNNNGGSRLV